MKSIFLLFMTIRLISFSQISERPNIFDSPAKLKKMGIRSLFISNCINKSDCYKYYYEFNKNGQISEEWIPMVSYYEEYKYDNIGRLKTLISLEKSEKRIINYKSIYKYLNKDSIDILRYSYENGKIFRVKRYKIKSGKNAKPTNIIRNKNGEIIQHTYGNFDYPCGNLFYGNHIVKYFYNKKGLISNAYIYDKRKLLISLTYEYKRK